MKMGMTAANCRVTRREITKDLEWAKKQIEKLKPGWSRDRCQEKIEYCEGRLKKMDELKVDWLSTI